MAKRRLQISLLFLDIITLISIFVFIYVIFEIEIKKILVNYSIDKFYENMRTTQFDFTNALSYIEQKKDLPYNESINEIFNYLKKSTLQRAKYDESIFIILLPEEENFIYGGKKNNLNFHLKIENLSYNKFRLDIDKLPLKISQKDLENKIFLNVKEEDKKILLNGYNKLENNYYILSDNLLQEDKERIRNILIYTKYAKKESITQAKYITFNYLGKRYIGIGKFSDVGIRKHFDRKSIEFIYPLFIIADDYNDFFYLIDRVKNTFIFLLLLIFLLVGIFKFINTLRVTKEIKKISDMLKKESENIRKKGIIGEALKDIETTFLETSNLHESSKDLGHTLSDLKKTISGISDEELFNAVVMGDNSILEEHEVRMGIIFLDIQGFTTITERHKLNSMKIVNHIWTEVEDVIKKYSGKINKFIGDACLIIFEENKDNIDMVGYNAFCSAVEMLLKVQDINSYLNKTFNPESLPHLTIDFNFRVGMDAGIVKKGKTGTDRNYELGVIGDHVNTASRFEGLNKQYHTNYLFTENAYGEIIKGFMKKYDCKDIEEVKNRIKDIFNVGIFNVDRARPKGKSEPKEMYTVFKYDENDYRIFLGSLKKFNKDKFEYFSALLKKFHDSIKYWQDYNNNKENIELKNIAIQSWANIAKQFAEFYYNDGFPPSEHFIKIILKYEEFEEYKKRPEEWLKKDKILVKEPSEDWIKLGAMELDK